MGYFFGISIGTKQTVGASIFVCSLIITIFSSNTKKERIREIGIKGLSTLAVILSIGVYLIVTNSLEEFVDYTMIGLNNFTNNKFTYLEFLIKGNYAIVLISIILIIIGLFNLWKTIQLKNEKITIVFLYSLSTFSMIYPIADENHILMAFLPTCLLGLCLLWNDSIVLNEKMTKEFSKWLYLGSFVLSSILIFNCYQVTSYREYQHYEYISIEEKLENSMNHVISFIKKYPNTYILSKNEVLYMIPLDRYNGILDLPNLGNLGEKGEQAIIDYINQLKGVYILTLPSEVMGGANQNPKKTAEYIEENFEYISNIEFFKIYYKP